MNSSRAPTHRGDPLLEALLVQAALAGVEDVVGVSLVLTHPAAALLAHKGFTVLLGGWREERERLSIRDLPQRTRTPRRAERL